jgi:hypothetical protein
LKGSQNALRRDREETPMAFDMYGVVKIKNSDPEVFWIIFADSSMSKGNPLMQFSDDFDESGVRAQLAKMGLLQAKIDELILRARANPK